jgi:hypothetical protein
LNLFCGACGTQIPVSRIAANRRAELAEKILLKLIEVSPAATMASEEGEGIRLAWQIADAFLKAENS